MDERIKRQGRRRARLRHAVALIAQRRLYAWLICDCGTLIDAEDPDRLAYLFQVHRSAFGRPYRNVSDA